MHKGQMKVDENFYITPETIRHIEEKLWQILKLKDEISLTSTSKDKQINLKDKFILKRLHKKETSALKKMVTKLERLPME